MDKISMTKYCRKCGAKLDSKDKFCPKCGETITELTPNSSSNLKNVSNNDSSKKVENKNFFKDNKNLIIICATAIIAVLIVAGGIIYYNNTLPTGYAYNIDGYNFKIPSGYTLYDQNHTTEPTIDTYLFNNSDGDVFMIMVCKDSGINLDDFITQLESQGDYYYTYTMGNISGYYASSSNEGGTLFKSFMFASSGDFIIISASDESIIEEIISPIVQQPVTTSSTSSSDSGSSDTSSSVSSSSDSGDSVVSEGTVNINGNDYNRVYYSDGSYKTYGTVTGKLYENTHDSEPIDQEPYTYKI